MGRQPEGKRRMQEDTQQLQCSVRMQRSGQRQTWRAPPIHHLSIPSMMHPKPVSPLPRQNLPTCWALGRLRCRRGRCRLRCKCLLHEQLLLLLRCKHLLGCQPRLGGGSC